MRNITLLGRFSLAGLNEVLMYTDMIGILRSTISKGRTEDKSGSKEYFFRFMIEEWPNKFQGDKTSSGNAPKLLRKPCGIIYVYLGVAMPRNITLIKVVEKSPPPSVKS